MPKYKSVSQLFVVGVRDLRRPDEILRLIKDFQISGVALFNAPHDSADYIWRDEKEGMEVLHEFISKVYPNVSFLSVDHEGGRVQRLRGPFIHLPAAQRIQQAFSRTPRKDLLYQLYLMNAQQLNLTGIGLNFAPVVDLAITETNISIGDRSFSTRPNEIIQNAQIFCEAYQEAGVSCTLKHFPGLGSSSFDSHEQIAVLQKAELEIRSEDMRIFEELGGFANGIMTAHCAFSDQPKKILSMDRDFLNEARSKMASHLFWITDDIGTMKSVSNDKPARKAFDAGYDYLLACGSLEHSIEMIEDCIRYVETLNLDFSQEQQLELRCRHAVERFDKKSIASFQEWEKTIRGISQDSLTILEQFDLDALSDEPVRS